MEITGIYLLSFDDRHVKCYIGQSTHINRRYADHKNKLLLGKHCNYKLQKEYDTLGMLPNLLILSKCSISELDEEEIVYIREFDSINQGFNITSGGSSGGRGVHASKSIYTEQQVTEVFFALANPNLCNIDISNELNLPITLIESIAYNKRHKWVSEKYPAIREIVDTNIKSNVRSNRSNDTNTRNGTVYRVISPEGILHEFSNIAKFAREHSLNQSHLNQLILGKAKQHKNWRKEVSNV